MKNSQQPLGTERLCVTEITRRETQGYIETTRQGLLAEFLDGQQKGYLDNFVYCIAIPTIAQNVMLSAKVNIMTKIT